MVRLPVVNWPMKFEAVYHREEPMLEMLCHVRQPLQLQMPSKRRRSSTTSMRGTAAVISSNWSLVSSYTHALIFRSVELFKALKALKADPTVGQHILDVRGRGLMVGVEFASPSHSTFDPAVRKGTPANLAMKLSKRCLEKGLLLLTTSVYETVRFIPPLNISSEDLAKGMGMFREAVDEVVNEGK
jgi:acetylornithine/succinyldiaminopimelate/putrescine aminotransferase